MGKWIKWSKELCHIEALKYSTKSEFTKKSYTASKNAKKLGVYNFITSHMDVIHKPFGYWSIEQCHQEALKYTFRSQFMKECVSGYSIAHKNGWLDEICSHMKPLNNWSKRLVYVYEFSDNHVYVGLTYNIEKRNEEHLNNNKSPIYKHIEQTGINPKLTYDEYVNAIDAQKLEEETIKKYKDNNWIILNKAKTGSLGGNRIKLTKEKCHKEALKYKTRNEFQNNNASAYKKAREQKWLNEICQHMISYKKSEPKSFYSFEKCSEEALKYSNRTEFQNNCSNAYNVSLQNKWLDIICSHMIDNRIKWNYETCKQEALKYKSRSEFKKKKNSCYKVVCKNGWLNEICDY